ncbi:MBL fold metallo-hydrolase [Microbacterium sp. ISL-59]|uniref:MBL fold metallo-hydrolase n=1 Tax=Microbacterium sp. ISL-59 TaxID=2819159 RepID=UPI001BE97318|nr:MBL fold metallo-hydrolase [Microbacterium sp. ISL-59]MBT2496720.1 MBL fold metallo-hydrolase [Microbacterium sp. ISL-59]
MSGPSDGGGEGARLSRRTLLTGAGVGAAGLAFGSDTASASPQRKDRNHRTRVVLAGTAGGPPPQAGRLGICTVIVVEDRAYIVDLGPSGVTAYANAGLTMEQIRSVFVTHLHSDHIAELYNLFWLNYGAQGARGKITGPVDIYGPGRADKPPQAPGAKVQNPDDPTPGLTDFLTSSVAGTAYDLNTRMTESRTPDIWEILKPHDIALAGIDAGAANRVPAMEPIQIMDDGFVKVTAILVDHPPVFPSFAFRFDTADGSVVVSGDTAPCDNLIRLARGADVLVHEVYDHDYFTAINPRLAETFSRTHTASHVVGGVAAAAGVTTLVLNHLVPAGISDVRDSVWKRNARRGFSDEVIVGRDGDEIGVGRRRR